MNRLITLVSAAAMSLSLTAGIASAKEVFELKLSHFLPSSHPTQKDFIEPWAQELEKRTNGRVKVTIYSAGSALGHVAKQYDQVRAGVVDIAHGLTGIPSGRLPKTLIMDMPFLAKTSDAATRALWQLYPEYLKDEYRGMKVLALHAHNGGLIHTQGKQVKSMADLAGLRLRAPSKAVSMMLKELGSVPVGMPPTQVYENLQKGVLDGTVFPYEAVYGFKLDEVLDYHLDAKAYTTSFYFVMNEKKYNALPADIRAVIDDISGDRLVAKFGPWWNQWDKPGIESIKKRGNTVVTLTEDQRQEWSKELEPMIEGYLAALEKKGIKNSQEIYAKAQQIVSQYE